MVNVRYKRCAYPGCLKQPSYGVECSKTAEFSVLNIKSRGT